MFIFVKTLSGKTITIDIDENDPISVLQKKIEEKEKIPPAKQRIIYAGKELEATRTIASYDIKKEAILHLVIAKSEQNNSQLTKTEQKEERKAKSSGMMKYYNQSVGLHDELQTYKDSESKFDVHANPEGAEYDLGKDGEFKEYNVVIGRFSGECGLGDAKQALQKKGFGVFIEDDHERFMKIMHKADVIWVIAGSQSRDSKLMKKLTKNIIEFHAKGGGVMIWGDNAPYFVEANHILPELLKTPKMQLIENTPGGKSMKLGNGKSKSTFLPHILTTGIITLFEGVTICYPNELGPLKVLGTSSDGHPAVCYADNECLKSETCGRIIVDCGWTKNYCSWHEAGTARYVSNATIWLLNLENKTDEEGNLKEKKKMVIEEEFDQKMNLQEKPTPQSTEQMTEEVEKDQQIEKVEKIENVQTKAQKTQNRRSLSQKLSSVFSRKS